MIDIDPTIILLLVTGLLAVLTISARWPFAFTAIIIVFNERFFGLLPYRFGDYDLARQAAGPVLLILAIITQVVFRPGRFRRGLRNGVGSYLPVVLAIIGAVTLSTLWGGLLIYKQSLRTLIFQPAVFTYYFIYVYLCFFSPDKKQILRFLGFIVITAITVAVLMTIDARIFHEARILKYATNVSGRIGLLRIVIFTTGIIWAYYYSLASADEEQHPPRRKVLFGLSALFLLSALVFILLDRQNMLFCFLTTAVITLSMKPWKKLFVAWIMALFLLVIIANPDFSFEKSAMGRLVEMTNIEAKTSESSIGIRFKAMEFYYEHFKNTYGLGFGVLGARPEYRNPVSKGLEHGYNLNDLSLSGIIFQFGIPGLFVIIVTAWKMLRDTGRILKKTRDPALRSITRGIRYMLIHLVIIFPLTTFLFYSEKAVYFAIMFFLVERLGSIVRAEAGAAA